MKKTIFLLIFICSSYLFADFIIPTDDPVYVFLEMLNTLKKTQINLSQYPIYYNDIINDLTRIAADEQAGIYQHLAKYHLKRIKLDFPEENSFALSSPYKAYKSVTGLVTADPTHKRLFTLTNPEPQKNTHYPIISETINETNIYLSGILGYQFDFRKTEEDKEVEWHGVNRTYSYYGVESAGNFYFNFGYFFRFQKGHYCGNSSFIEENPFLTKKPDGTYFGDEQSAYQYYQNDLTIDIDFKNKYLNFGFGYGSFSIGRHISSSIILNSNVTPYGYIKYSKQFSIFTYTGLTSQLIPDREIGLTTTNFSPSPSKAMSFQTMEIHTDLLTFGLGNSIVYGDKSLDLAYSTPLALYKIIDNKYGTQDNGFFFGYSEIRLLKGLNIFANFNFDDLRQNRFTSQKYLSYSAYQAGLLTQHSQFPLELGLETTVAGPSIYSHNSSNTYLQDNQLLGHQHGANFLSLVSRVRFIYPRFTLSFTYENLQQGNNYHHPSVDGGDQKFLADKVVRKQFYKASYDLRIISELFLFSRCEYQILPNDKRLYLYNGAEFKY